ncbi:hypothetical protein D9757_003735 [Collybiopsis confluens]|uniref:Protein kinase domain-containing protein n=1 Tax=Collybiopsis confluens TaxID=2823264 RepID=A0A8H5HV19_9AGAR|nr:hypothetical protein D9757_003735 [Collybiopsis confluens]
MTSQPTASDDSPPSNEDSHSPEGESTLSEPPPSAAYYHVIYEIRGKILDYESIRKNTIADPLLLVALEELIIPRIKGLDPSISNDKTAKLCTSLYKISLKSFDVLMITHRTRKTLNLEGSAPFILSAADDLPEYTLVVFRPEDRLPPGTHRSPSLLSLGTQPFLSDPASLDCPFSLQNDISRIGENTPGIPSHVQKIWKDLAKQRNLLDRYYQKLERKLRNISYPADWLSKMFAPTSVETENKATDGSGDKSKDDTNHEAESDGTSNVDPHLRREEMMTEEYEHYVHVIKNNNIAGVTKTLSLELGVERTTEYYFFTRLAMYIRKFVSDFVVLDHYQSMPVTKLVIEKLDEQEDFHRYAPYTPRSDIDIWHRMATWPGILVELQSGDKITAHIELSDDHIRLLLQGGCLLRMMNIAQDRVNDHDDDAPTAVLPLLYVTKDWTHASIYLLFQSTSSLSAGPIMYLERSYDIQANLSERIRFTKDLYNLCEHIEVYAPSEDLRDEINAIDADIHGISTTATRKDTKDDKKRKRDAGQGEKDGGGDGGEGGGKGSSGGGSSGGGSSGGGSSGGGSSGGGSSGGGGGGGRGGGGGGGKRGKPDPQQTKAEGVKTEGLHGQVIEAGLCRGYQLQVKSPRLLFGESTEGFKVVAKMVSPKSDELKINLKLQSLEWAGSMNHFLPILEKFNSSSHGLITSTYLILPCWTPLPEIRNLVTDSFEISDMCSALAQGIEFLHSNLIAHLDIKPDNLVIQKNLLGKMELRIIDFSVSVMLAYKGETIDSYQGTIGFMAPEVARCEKVQSPDNPDFCYSPIQADLYSCGRVFYYLSRSMENSAERRKVLKWGRELTAIDPGARSDLTSLPGLLPAVY